MTNASSAAGHTALLQAARAEFAEHGYASVSIRSLAERAGISASMLYHYYASKQQLLEAIVLEAVDAYLASCRAELATTGFDPVARLAAVIGVTIRFCIAGPTRIGWLYQEERNVSPGFREVFGKRLEEATELVRGPIAAGIAAGVFCSVYPEEGRRAIIAMCVAVGDWYDPAGVLAVDEVVRRHVELALTLLEYRAG